MAQAARRLHLVEVDDNGEARPLDNQGLIDLKDKVEKLALDLKMAERELRAKRRQIAELERDKQRERDEHPDREKVERVHDYWQRRMGSRCALTPDRFDAVAGIMGQQRTVKGPDGRKRREPAYAYPDDFKRAIDGYFFDHFSKQRKNGSMQHFWDLELICRDGKNFEEGVARAPVS